MGEFATTIDTTDLPEITPEPKHDYDWALAEYQRVNRLARHSDAKHNGMEKLIAEIETNGLPLEIHECCGVYSIRDTRTDTYLFDDDEV